MGLNQFFKLYFLQKIIILLLTNKKDKFITIISHKNCIINIFMIGNSTIKY